MIYVIKKQFKWYSCWTILLCIFFLHSFCSIIGGTIISIGLYAVLWGKATEETDEEDFGSLESSQTTEHAPLLQSYRIDQTSEKLTNGNV